jgi:outer membrane protein assembly factor BamB
MKQKSLLKTGTLACSAFIIIFTSCSQKQNWPQFRGPNSNMISVAKDLPEEWDSVKNVAWTYKLDGAGWSSPIVWGDKIFFTSCFPEKVAPVPERNPMQTPPPPPASSRPGQAPMGGQQPQTGQGPRPGPGQPGAPPQEDTDTAYKEEVYRWEITCVDLTSGKELWKQVAFHGNPGAKKHPMNNYATETPAADGERVFAYFGNTGLFCYDLDGKLLWKKDFGTNKVLNGWGTGSSPLVFNGSLFIQNDNEENSFIVSLDAKTGEEKWRMQREEKTNYSTPYIWTNKIRSELIVNGKTARSYDPETGKLLWELNTGGEQTIPSPVGDENTLYIGNAGGQNAKGNLYAVKAGAEGDINPAEGATTSNGVLWIFPDAGLGNGSPLLYEGHYYIIGSRGGEIKCIKAGDGSLVYKERISGTGAVWASPWIYNGKVWFLDDKGVTRSFTAGDKFELVSDNRLKDTFWASVAITDNGYVFKGVKALYCVRK